MVKGKKITWKVHINVEELYSYTDLEIKEYQKGCQNKPPIKTGNITYHTRRNMITIGA